MIYDLRSQNRKSFGFSLIEILLSLFFIAALVTILLTTTGSFLTRRQSNLQSLASKIASKEIERLRSVNFINIQNGTENNLTCNTTQDPDLSKLPGGCMDRLISDYDPPNQKIYSIRVTVKWNNENDKQQNVSMDTLIYKYGL